MHSDYSLPIISGLLVLISLFLPPFAFISFPSYPLWSPPPVPPPYLSLSLSPLNLTENVNVGVSGFGPIRWNLVGSAAAILLFLCSPMWVRALR